MHALPTDLTKDVIEMTTHQERGEEVDSAEASTEGEKAHKGNLTLQKRKGEPIGKEQASKEAEEDEEEVLAADEVAVVSVALVSVVVVAAALAESESSREEAEVIVRKLSGLFSFPLL